MQRNDKESTVGQTKLKFPGPGGMPEMILLVKFSVQKLT